MLAELEQGEGGRRAPGDEGGVAAADRLEAATGVEHLLEAADQIAVQQAQARADVGEVEQARIIFGEGLADTGAGQRGRGFVELALLHQGLGEKGGGVAQEAGRRPPGLAGGQRLAGLGLRLAQVASQDIGLRAKELRDSEGEGRPAPVCLGECVLVDRQNLVQIRHRQHGAGEDEGCAEDLLLDQRSLGKRAARERDGHRGRRARPRIVIGKQRKQGLFAERRVRGPAADARQPFECLAVQRRHEDGAGDERRLEQALELGIGAGELHQRLGVDGVRLLAAEEEELAAEQQRGLGSSDRVVDQCVCLPEMLDGGVAADDRLGGAELEQQVGALGRGRRLGERAAEVGDRALGSTARAGALGGVAQRPDDLCVRGRGSAAAGARRPVPAPRRRRRGDAPRVRARCLARAV